MSFCQIVKVPLGAFMAENDGKFRFSYSGVHKSLISYFNIFITETIPVQCGQQGCRQLSINLLCHAVFLARRTNGRR